MASMRTARRGDGQGRQDKQPGCLAFDDLGAGHNVPVAQPPQARCGDA
jgi:hypothetical protein